MHHISLVISPTSPVYIQVEQEVGASSTWMWTLVDMACMFVNVGETYPLKLTVKASVLTPNA